jgi:hypothetical protein
LTPGATNQLYYLKSVPYKLNNMKKHTTRSKFTVHGARVAKGFFCRVTVILLLVLSSPMVQAQSMPADSSKMLPVSQQVSPKTVYPKVVGYLSFILPLITVSDATTFNFSSTTTIGFPIGINVLYSDRFGFSYEFTPNIRAGIGYSKLNDLLFDPGTMFRFDHGFTLITRLAFDTNGRYGFTPVFNQVYLRTKDVNYFVALSLPARFGNSEASSVGLNLQIGFIFN